MNPAEIPIMILLYRNDSGMFFPLVKVYVPAVKKSMSPKDQKILKKYLIIYTFNAIISKYYIYIVLYHREELKNAVKICNSAHGIDL